MDTLLDRTAVVSTLALVSLAGHAFAAEPDYADIVAKNREESTTSCIILGPGEAKEWVPRVDRAATNRALGVI
ncbi:MAG: hypothetical protein JKX70_11840 [Phycisphaerales bacterium]|nr:hypothetical protein [Phycisphaerales bacterium]